jgi:hypothetical protein
MMTEPSGATATPLMLWNVAAVAGMFSVVVATAEPQGAEPPAKFEIEYFPFPSGTAFLTVVSEAM